MTHNRWTHTSEDDAAEHGYGITAEDIAAQLAELGDEHDEES